MSVNTKCSKPCSELPFTQYQDAFLNKYNSDKSSSKKSFESILMSFDFVFV